MKVLALMALVVSAHAGTDSFDDAAPGVVAAIGHGKWSGTQTGNGTAKWAIEKDASAPSGSQVLAQRGEADYPVALRTDTSLKDGFVEVKFKPVAGKEDQAGGVVWRARDPGNYYIARANALENNVTIYHTTEGRRVSFKSADLPVTSARWHTLRVDFHGPRFTVTFDGRKVIEADDDRLKQAGKVGVWTKADSVTLFDDFSWGEK